MAKFYAVAKGRNGEGNIYNTWDECKKDVIGFKGAIYKSFTLKEDAEIFLKNCGVNKYQNEKVIKNDLKEVEVYVDGSFNVSTNEYSYGLVVILDSKVIYEENGKKNDEASSMRNVAGEILGAMKAIDFVKKNNYDSVVIYFDYQGIESWAKGTWKRNNYLTQGYNEFMKKTFEEIDVKFIKVKGHSGDKYNDRADYLAKKALNIN